MGGDCLNYGCVPSKALLAAAKHAAEARHVTPFGLTVPRAEIDFAKVNAHVHRVIAAIAPNDSKERFVGLGVHVIEGAARFKDKTTVTVGDVRDQGAAFRHRDRLAGRGAADPGPRRDAVFHQRDDLRAQALPRASHHHRRRTDRA